jgi:hypothetical protein
MLLHSTWDEEEHDSKETIEQRRRIRNEYQ